MSLKLQLNNLLSEALRHFFVVMKGGWVDELNDWTWWVKFVLTKIRDLLSPSLSNPHLSCNLVVQVVVAPILPFDNVSKVTWDGIRRINLIYQLLASTFVALEAWRRWWTNQKAPLHHSRAQSRLCHLSGLLHGSHHLGFVSLYLLWHRRKRWKFQSSPGTLMQMIMWQLAQV